MQRQLIPEEQLIRQCQKADRKAQKMVYEKYAGKMLAVCKRYLRRQDEAEDALLQAFLKVFQKIDLYKSQGSFEGWIRRIVVNECLNMIRSQKMLFVDIEAPQLAQTLDYETLNTQLEAEDLMNLLEKLPAGYRTVFNLYAIEGYSHQEIAELLQISEGTSKSQLSRARQLLQKYLIETENALKNQQHG